MKNKGLYIFIILTVALLYAERLLCQPFIGVTGGHNTKELTFGADASYIFKDALYGEVDYFYSNEKEVFSIHAGLVPWHTDNFKLLIGFGSEVNNDFAGKVSTSFWARVSDVTWITAGIETANDNAYFSIGLKLQFVPVRDGKPKRFF